MGFWRRLLQVLFGTRVKDSVRRAPVRPPSEPSCDQLPDSTGSAVETPQPPSPFPAPTAIRTSLTGPRRAGPRAITIGLDFGTHSTKIVLRPRGAEKAALLQISKPQEGYPWFACPSLVKVVDDRVYFGSRALEVSGGKLYRSLKVQLLPPEGDDATDHVFPSGLTPDLLVAWYLSWVLGRIKLAIDKFFKHSNPRLSLNLAAPMNHIENESLKARYLGIVQAAWESVFGKVPSPVQQGMRVKEMRAKFASWLEKEVPSRETRPFEILPETVAPIVSLSFDPRMDPGMYMIVDIGAGTTEISYFPHIAVAFSPNFWEWQVTGRSGSWIA